MIDNRENTISLSMTQVNTLCNRHFGIGADGLIVLSNDGTADFYMRYYNSDGNESTMCGNGGRCITAFASKLGIITNSTLFNAIDGRHEAKIIELGENSLHIMLKMKDVDRITKTENTFSLNTGSPHWVSFAENVGLLDMVKEGRKIRYSMLYADEGINVNFVEVHPDFLFIRTYERGVEDETLSCGTGVTASALAYSYDNNIPSPVKIKTKGGELKVSFVQKGSKYEDVWLEGPAQFVFEGDIEI